MFQACFGVDPPSAIVLAVQRDVARPPDGVDGTDGWPDDVAGKHRGEPPKGSEETEGRTRRRPTEGRPLTAPVAGGQRRPVAGAAGRAPVAVFMRVLAWI